MTYSSSSKNQNQVKEEWSEVEKWVWEQICKGNIADFNERYNKELSPEKEDGWNEERLIRQEFLEAVLFEDPFCNLLHRNGIIISGAWFNKIINLSRANIRVELQILNSRFEETVDLTHLKCSSAVTFERSVFVKSLVFSYARIESYLSLVGSKVKGELDMNTLFIGSSLFMRNGTEFNDIMLRSSTINGHLDLSDTKVFGTLDMDSITIGFGLIMRNKSEFKNVILIGAKVRGYVDLNSAIVTEKITMDSIFVGSSLFVHNNAKFNNLYMNSAEVNGQIEMGGIKVTGLLDMNSLSVKSHLFIRKNAELNEVNLISADIRGQFDMSGAKISGKLDMNSITVGNSLFMRGITAQNVYLRDANINGQLDLNKSKVSGVLDIGSASVSSVLFLDESEFNDVVLKSGKINGITDLGYSKITGRLNLESLELNSHLFLRMNNLNNISMLGTKINGQLDMTGAEISGEVYIESAFIEKNVFLRAKSYKGKLSFIISKVNGSVYISDAEIYHLDFGGTHIHGELHIGSSGQNVKWQPNSFMNLRNADVGAIMDTGEDAWPDEINLDGFTYSRLGGLFGHNETYNKQIAERESDWFAKWMEKDKSYTPQPYQHLAGVLVRMGYPDKANAVLYEAKNRERDEAKKHKQFKRWFGLSLLKWTIGYGYGGRYFRSLIWVASLVAVGVIVLSTLEIDKVPKILDKIIFSADMLLPIISLDNRYELDFSGWQLYYFYFHKLMGFLLGSFVLAGLSGITKR